MSSIKTDISRKEDGNQLNINASKFSKKRNLLRGVFILCCFLWIATLGVTLYLMGDQWWPITLTVLFAVPTIVLTYIFFQIKKLDK